MHISDSNIISSVAVICSLNRFSHVRHFVTLWTVACQAPVSMGFFRQEYSIGLPCPPSGDLSDQGSNLCLLQFLQFSSVQSLSHAWLFATPWIAAHQASLSITISQSSLRLTSIESVMPSSHLILCHPLLLLPPIPPSIRLFSNESALCMRWSSTGVSSSASFLPKKPQGWSPSEWIGWISLQPKGLSESFPTSQFKIINSSVLSLLHNPTLTSIRDHWKNHSLD